MLNRLEDSILEQVKSDLESQLGKGILNTQIGVDILKQATVQVRDQLKEKLQSQLEVHLGSEFLNTEEGRDIHQQLSTVIDAFSLNGR